MHMRSHSKKTKYKCLIENCTFKTAYAHVLKKHKKEIHENLRPFACDHPGCDYAAKRKEHLIHHKITHNKEKPYKCTYCTFGANQKHSLALHIKKMHSEFSAIIDEETEEESDGQK